MPVDPAADPAADPAIDPAVRPSVPAASLPPDDARNRHAVFASHWLYRLGAGLALVLVVLFGWEVRRTLGHGAVEVGTLLFLGLAMGLLLRNGWLALSRVEMGPEQVTLYRPLMSPRSVTYRQLAGVYEEGRGRKAILLVYYPRRADGLYELDELSTLALPAVADHAALYTTLAARASAG